jgi:putative DNA primase/helicase
VGISDKIAEEGSKAKAGQLVRCVDLDAQVSEEWGIHNDLHGFKNGAELSNHLNARATKYYGVVAEAFIRRLLDEPDPEETVVDRFENAKQLMTKKLELTGSDGQALRVMDVFAVAIATGMLASQDSFGVLTHNSAGIKESICYVFERWLKDGGRIRTRGRRLWVM